MEPGEQASEPVGIAPYLTAILLCDQVIEDTQTKKPTLVGVFDRVSIPAFPHTLAMALFARFTDAEGVYQFRIEYVRVPTNQVLAIVDLTTEPIPDRLRHYQIIARMGLQFGEPGSYEMRLSANGAYLGRAPLEVVAADASGGASHGD
jgi:hypothetical protein